MIIKGNVFGRIFARAKSISATREGAQEKQFANSRKGGNMDQAEHDKWENAEKYMKMIEEAHRSLDGGVGMFALAQVINPLKKRFYAWERSEELYEAIKELE